MDFHVDSETGPSEPGHPAPAGPESEAAHSHEQGRALADELLAQGSLDWLRAALGEGKA